MTLDRGASKCWPKDIRYKVHENGTVIGTHGFALTKFLPTPAQQHLHVKIGGNNLALWRVVAQTWLCYADVEPELLGYTPTACMPLDSVQNIVILNPYWGDARWEKRLGDLHDLLIARSVTPLAAAQWGQEQTRAFRKIAALNAIKGMCLHNAAYCIDAAMYPIMDILAEYGPCSDPEMVMPLRRMSRGILQWVRTYFQNGGLD